MCDVTIRLPKILGGPMSLTSYTLDFTPQSPMSLSKEREKTPYSYDYKWIANVLDILHHH